MTLQCLIFGFENQTSPLDGFQSIEDEGPWGWNFKGFQRAEANLELLKGWDVGDGRRTRAGESLRTKSGTGVPQKLYWAAAQNSQRCSSNLGRLRGHLPGSSADKESSCNAGDPGSNSWVRKIPWRRDRLYPLQYSGLENSVDCIVREVSKSQTQLSNFHFQGL